MGIKIDEMNQTHLGEFIKSLPESYGREPWHGRNVKEWWTDVLGRIKCKTQKTYLSKLCAPNVRLKRYCLKSICRNANNSDLLCLVSIMAWGNRDMKNAKLLFGDKDSLQIVECIIKKLRNGSLLHFDAYEKFHTAHKEGQIKGLGVAFYTKIIFFCDPNHKGYIMDQWTAKSVNLLMRKNDNDKQIVLVDKNKYTYVNKKNEKQRYERFCEIIDYLAEKGNLPKQFDWSGEDVEKALFSKGDKDGPAWKWRKHVREHYKPIPPKK